MSENSDKISAQIEKEGKAFFYTRGFSMLPMLKEGRDVSVLVPLSREPARGDVVLFIRRHNNDRLILHRVIRKRDKDTYIIRGDNAYFNEPVKKDDILALLEGFFRKGKYYDCEKSKRYKAYSALRVFFFPLRKLVRVKLRRALAKVKNNVFHLNNLHLDNILGIKR